MGGVRAPGIGSAKEVAMREDTKLARIREAMRTESWDEALKLTSRFQRLGAHAEAIQRAAADADRQIEPDHFGISLAVGDGELPPEVAAAVRKRRPDVDPAELVAAGWDQLHRQLDAYLQAGLTKFVIRQTGTAPVDEFIDRFVAELAGRQN